MFQEAEGWMPPSRKQVISQYLEESVAAMPQAEAWQ